MESGKLRPLMLLNWLSFFALSVQGHSESNQEDVIDLLAALNMSQDLAGVARLQSGGSEIYRIRPKAPFMILPPKYTHFLYSNIHGSMGVHLVGHQSSGSSATLFSLSSKSLPLLQIVSSTPNKTLRLDYRPAGGAQMLASIHFPMRNPFSTEEWVQLAVSLEPDRLTWFVDCQEAIVVLLKREERINLDLPQDFVVTLGSTPGKKHSKFSGHLKTAEISMKAYVRRPWFCKTVTDNISLRCNLIVWDILKTLRVGSQDTIACLLSKSIIFHIKDQNIDNLRPTTAAAETLPVFLDPLFSFSFSLQEGVILTGGCRTGDCASGDCGSVGTGDCGSVASGDCGSVATGDTGSVASGDCGSVASGDCGSVGTGDCGSVSTWDCGFVASGDCGSVGTVDCGSVASGDCGSVSTLDCGSVTTGDCGSRHRGLCFRGLWLCRHSELRLLNIKKKILYTIKGAQRTKLQSNKISNKNSKGPKTDPCDTPHERGILSDMICHSRELHNEQLCFASDIQSDQLQRGVVLGPPGSPQVLKSVSEAQKDDRLNKLEKRLDEVSLMLDMVKAQVTCQSTIKEPSVGCDTQSHVKCNNFPSYNASILSEHDVKQDGLLIQLMTTIHGTPICSPGQVSTLHGSCRHQCVSHLNKSKIYTMFTFNSCLFLHVSYVNNSILITFSDGCQTCKCKGGTRECSPLPCPPLDCTQKESVPGHCCQQCRGCIHSGVRHDHGAKWRPVEKSCDVCYCLNGNVVCSTLPCPALSCQNPVHKAGECCPRCEQCEYESRVYMDGQMFSSRRDPCLYCRCSAGEVTCDHMDTSCPTAHCSHPARHKGECCPTCEGQYNSYTVFPFLCSSWQPEGPCSSCTCVNGETLCTHTHCHSTECLHPTKNRSCCAVCESCTFNHRIYSNGQRFTSPDQPCHICICQHGTVACERKPCPPLNCTNSYTPPGECCPKCPGFSKSCAYAGKEYPNGQEFPHPTDKCRTCSCINGNVQCLMKRCPPLPCSNPNILPGDCCPQCPGKDHRPYRHTERFYHPADNCRLCACTNGTVHCQRKPCPFASCSHPITQECCRSCEGCMFHGKEYADSTEFSDDKDPCGVCYCYGGEVICTKLPCYGDCSHPYKPPGQCCGECERCFYNGAVFTSGQSIPDPGNPCSECTCQSGSVQCVKKKCPAVLCPYPITNSCGCPVCDGCQFQDVAYVDGQIFPGGEKGCQDCKCSRGEVVCAQRRCPAVSCSHPALDSCACGVCDGCNFNGRDCFNGERFPHPADHCQLCSCLNGGVVCMRRSCPSVACVRPVTHPGECCPVCTGMCLHHGKEYQSGSTFTSPSDPCSSCFCLNELVNCQKRPCPVQCSHPVSSDACCPVCDSCLYEGVVHSHSHTFSPSSNLCQRCTCVRGTVTCVPLVCPPLPCAQPVAKPGQCCPDFFVFGHSKNKNKHFKETLCFMCILDGQEFSEVQCAPECPKLPCMHQVTDPGACCPRCRGCVYEGEEHAEGSSWFADSTPCMSCMCVDGVTTCSEVHCLSPCMNFIRVPGECCPVCADCVFEGRVYGPGDNFNPANDPCQICTCEVMPDGEQHLMCYRKQCPSLVDCPKSNILFAGPESCCPVCAQPLSNCTAALIGNEVLATDDPCFTCHCKDLTWTCLHQMCLPLSCPFNEQFTPPDSCCPVCKDCVIEAQNRRVANGSIWTDSDDDCITCTCNLGYIECSIEECLPEVCLNGHKQAKIPGKCCYECQDSGVSCLHQGTVYHSDERWEVDECTSCVCVSGDVHCHSERCPPLTCATDEMPSVVPGLCCPRCLPRPATCIAFGDPHYRTFDGRMLHFQGACTYVLAQDCEGGDFSIHATNDDRGRKGVSWTKEVTVFVGDVAVQLLQDWVVKVNDEVVTLPFLREPYLYIERQTNTILLNTNIGLKLLWSGRSHLEVSVPGSYKGHTCGLCGNFNNYHQDDLRMPSGQLSLSESDFGNSWMESIISALLLSFSAAASVLPQLSWRWKHGAESSQAVLGQTGVRGCPPLVGKEVLVSECIIFRCSVATGHMECIRFTLSWFCFKCRDAQHILQDNQSSWTAPTEAQNSRDGPGKALTVGSVRVQVADSTGKQEVCIGTVT
ncbi:Kielin/chordin-like protein Cysteine-rich motor neuron 2 protein [Channa argus]|uniref:Kielin/chordin-like protein Cysteine-rich motor neuron 2 protein n=1 Tax=Channa argus TaxID=215402 RepID=A0A6G1PEY9_CHAAH|nr:Kielin/chordin-like protein Cysteine-rich motor neuron 2 protein [Channa argus]